jgi:type IV pilus assembly protein PilV
MKQLASKESKQRGFMLLEVLVSILLFALGIAALVGLQARSLMVTDDMQYRAEAVHHAGTYVGKIWAAAGVASGGAVTDAQLIAQFSGANGTGGPGYRTFSNQVTDGIPGASFPTVAMATATVTYTNRSVTPPQQVNLEGVNVTITIHWADRQNVDQGGNNIVHTYTQTSFVGYNP